jgi:hypothetical protein
MLAKTMKQKGWLQAQHFLPQKYATSVMNVYKNIC